MKPFVFITIILFALTSCSKSNEEKPLPASIQAIIDEGNCTCDPFIDKYRYEGKTVYVRGSRGPACSSVVLYYDSEGNLMPDFNGKSIEDFRSEAKFIREVWSCKQ
jgi:hypothetical protein